MKKRLIAAALLLLLLPVVLLFAAWTMPKVYQDSYYAELPEMVARIDRAQGRRLIILGGSNVAFGLDVPLLEQCLRDKGFAYTICPLGLYAAVGASAMLSLSETALREGDVVVLALEPTSDTMTAYFGATAFLKCAESDPMLFTRLNADQRSRAAGNYLPYLQEKYEVVQSGQPLKIEGVYAKASFDDQCNMIYPREGNMMSLGYDVNEPIDLAAVTIEPAFADQVNAYCQAAKKKGAAVYMSFSPMNRSALTAADVETVYAYFNLCNDTFVCPVISNPLDYVLDSGWFFDSNFHLNTAGAQVRTILLAGDLLAQWGCYQAVDAALPAMPASIAQKAADQADSWDFTYERTENGQAYILTGLTDQGLNKETLILPAAYQGKPVAAIRADALKGAVNLVELHVPDSIASLPEGLLDDCAALRRLVLEHTSAPCSIAAHSLDGMKALQILVPAASYTWYRDGYGCEENPWQPYLSQIYSY
ncbi:MAG: hypothetical protein K5919_05475 [Clostridiales bacterium]|nr:hypothetical protein [Clostridiales bacterium]